MSDASAGILEVKKSLQKPMLLCGWQRATDTVTMRKQDINKALQNVEALLKEDQSASPQMRAMMQLLVTIIHLLAAKLGLDSSNSSTPPSKDPNRPRGAKNKAKGVPSGSLAVRMAMKAPTSRKKNIPIGSKP